MTNHRYTQLMVPIDRYIKHMTPGARRLLAFLEGSLLLVLLTSVLFYLR